MKIYVMIVKLHIMSINNNFAYILASFHIFFSKKQLI
jgi:hypothetical protein